MNVRKMPSVGATFTVLAMLGSAAVPTFAQTMQNDRPPSIDPAFAAADVDQPRHEFRLRSQTDTETVKYKKAHTLSLCVGKADPSAVNGTKHAYPVTASYNGKSTTVQPGKCATFTASNVSLKPATFVPPNDEVVGKISIVK